MTQIYGESKRTTLDLWREFQDRSRKKRLAEYNRQYFSSRYQCDEEFRERRRKNAREYAAKIRRQRIESGELSTVLTVWTDDKLDAVHSMLTAGKTATEIASTIGGVTRSAVLGIIYRRGWTRGSGGGS